MAPIDDPQGFNESLKRQREILLESEDVHEADRNVIDDWRRRKESSVTVGTMQTYLRRVRSASERSDVPLTEMDEDAFYSFVDTLRYEFDHADSTIESFENAVLMLVSDMTDKSWPDSADRTTSETNTVAPNEVLTTEEVQTLLTLCTNQRDRALIEFLADTGARVSMAASLRVKDLDLSKPPTYTPNPNAVGLKGASIRPYPLIDSAAAIRAYLRNAHPRPEERNVALFHKIKPHKRADDGSRWPGDGAIDPRSVHNQMTRLGDRADIGKRVHAHGFRHVAITRMAREGYTRSQIEHRVHWSLDSQMWETYEHIAGEQHNDDIFRQAGILDPEEGPDTIRKDCGNCNMPLSPNHEFCPNCGQAVSPGADDTVESGMDTVLDRIESASNPAEREELRTLLNRILDRPDTADVHAESPP